jgi:hypothetical protein
MIRAVSSLNLLNHVLNGRNNPIYRKLPTLTSADRSQGDKPEAWWKYLIK